MYKFSVIIQVKKNSFITAKLPFRCSFLASLLSFSRSLFMSVSNLFCKITFTEPFCASIINQSFVSDHLRWGRGANESHIHVQWTPVNTKAKLYVCSEKFGSNQMKFKENRIYGKFWCFLKSICLQSLKEFDINHCKHHQHL